MDIVDEHIEQKVEPIKPGATPNGCRWVDDAAAQFKAVLDFYATSDTPITYKLFEIKWAETIYKPITKLQYKNKKASCTPNKKRKSLINQLNQQLAR